MNVHLYSFELRIQMCIMKISSSLRTHDIFDEIGVLGLDSEDLHSQVV